MNPTEIGTDTDTESFLRDFCTFGKNRAYILISIARPKENDSLTHSNIPNFKEILTEQERIPRKIEKLRSLSSYRAEEQDDLTFRLYISANSRDTRTAFFNFQKDLINMNEKIDQGHEQTRERIKRLDSSWISALQSDEHRYSKRFIFDIDDPELYKTAFNTLSQQTEIVANIKTPNGYHILTAPFNYTNINLIDQYEEIELKKDGLLYLTTF